MIDKAVIDRIKSDNVGFAYKWKVIPVDQLGGNPILENTAHRLNALGDNFYFIKVVLRKRRLSNIFHRQYCNTFLKWSLKQVNEIPRDHFKTTVGLGMAMWWALPFNDKDENLMRQMGYGDEWIAWMRRAHDQNTRTLVAMEVIKNAWKVGRKITGEYKFNSFFKVLFPEIQPDSSCTWSADTMTHKRDYTTALDPNQGEGTYEFTGVDAALQSKHYKRCIYDDLFGREALKSELVAESTWEWVRLAVGAFDSDPDDPGAQCDEVVNGNRWSFHDLNWNIRKNLPKFKFETHDAEGSCCDRHPPNMPIFPEEWNMDKLHDFRNRLGEYYYSCQFRNKPIPPGGNVFKSEWLRRFVYRVMNVETVTPHFGPDTIDTMSPLGTFGTQTYRIIRADQYVEKRHKAIRHEIYDGEQLKDIPTSYLSKMLLVDPNHKGEKGRANHAILEMGVNRDPFNVYLLEGLAKNCSREDAVHHMYRMGEKWRNRTIWVETSAGQAWLETLLKFENEVRRQNGKWYFYDVKEFKDNRSENAKADRIEDTEPYFRRGQIWICSNDDSDFTTKFIEEYQEYPHGATVDILDILGHGLQNISFTEMSQQEKQTFKTGQQNQITAMNKSRSHITGY